MKPNFFTYARLALLPLMAYLLTKDMMLPGMVIFILAACTDFIDGALARTRNQITDLGKVLDPIADKLLVFTALFILGFEFLIVKIFLVFILLEIVAVLASVFLAYKIGRPIGANIFGKLKMILQSVAIVLLFIGLLATNEDLIILAGGTLALALIFAFISAYQQIAAKFTNLLAALNITSSKDSLKNIVRKI